MGIRGTHQRTRGGTNPGITRALASDMRCNYHRRTMDDLFRGELSGSHIDDQLLRELKALASENNMSLTAFVNQVIRRGIDAPNKSRKARKPYHEATCDLGQPIYDLRKALSRAATLEDEGVIRKIEIPKDTLINSLHGINQIASAKTRFGLAPFFKHLSA